LWVVRFPGLLNLKNSVKEKGTSTEMASNNNERIIAAARRYLIEAIKRIGDERANQSLGKGALLACVDDTRELLRVVALLEDPTHRGPLGHTSNVAFAPEDALRNAVSEETLRQAMDYDINTHYVVGLYLADVDRVLAFMTARRPGA
jgi:hypothetical protein